MIVLNASIHQVFLSLETPVRPHESSGPATWARTDEEHFRKNVKRYHADATNTEVAGSLKGLLSSGAWEPSRSDPTILGAFNLRLCDSQSTCVTHTIWSCNERRDSKTALKQLRGLLREPGEGEHSLQIVHGRIPDDIPDPDPEAAAVELSQWLSSTAIDPECKSSSLCDAFIATPDELSAVGWNGRARDPESARLWLSTDNRSATPYGRWAFLCRGDAFETWLTKDFLNVGLVLLSIHAFKAHEQLLWYARNKQTLERQQEFLRQRVREADTSPTEEETLRCLQSMGRVFEQNLGNLERRLITIRINLKNLGVIARQIRLDFSGDLGAPQRTLKQMTSQLSADLRYHRNTLQDARGSAFWAKRTPAEGSDRTVHVLSKEKNWQAIPVDEWEHRRVQLLEAIKKGEEVLVVDLRAGQNVIFSPVAPSGFRVGSADTKRLSVLAELMAYSGKTIDLTKCLDGDAIDASWRQFRRRFDKALKPDAREYLWLERQPASAPFAYRFRHTAAEWYLAVDVHARLEQLAGLGDGNVAKR